MYNTVLLYCICKTSAAVMPSVVAVVSWRFGLRPATDRKHFLKTLAVPRLSAFFSFNYLADFLLSYFRISGPILYY